MGIMRLRRTTIGNRVATSAWCLLAAVGFVGALVLADGSANARSSVPGTQVLEVAPVDSNHLPVAGVRVNSGGMEASCSAGSDSVGNAYRCFAGHVVYDPCWRDDSDAAVPAVLCQERPWDKRVVRLTLGQRGLDPFHDPPLRVASLQPWGVELTTGERCLAVQGSHSTLRTPHGRRVIDYRCWDRAGKLDKHELLRGIDRPRWRINSVVYAKGRRGPYAFVKLRIVTAWYATQEPAGQ
jgi:hypothetical protein